MSGRTHTPRSLAFRRRAAEIADKAITEPDADRMAALLQQALSWIQLAENEEFLAELPAEKRPVVGPHPN